MSAGVVIKIDHEFNAEGWRHVLKAFQITEVYELPGLGIPMTDTIKIERVVDVRNFHDTEFVVIQNPDGDFVSGVTNLEGVEHPDEAIYIFGGSLARLSEFDLEGANELARVYIPIGAVFPHQAGAVVLWDRYMKRGAS